MGTSRTLKKILAGALLSGIAVTGMVLAPGTAQARPRSLTPIHGLLPVDGPVPPGASGLHPQTGRGCPPNMNWDKTQCHTWYGVVWGHGNVSPGVWEGTGPPPPEATQKPWCGFPFMCSGTP
jgi:hypothetical protein